MAKDRYNIFIDRVDDTTVEWTVTILDRPLGEFPTTSSFAFSLLADPLYFSQYRKQDQLLESPMAAEADLEDILDPKWVREHAAGIVEEVELIDTGSSDDDQPTGTYRVTVVHPGWLEHLRPEMNWSTETDDVGPADPWEGPERRPFDRTEVLADDDTEGFHRLAEAASGSSVHRKHNVSKDALVPSKGDSYYRAVDPLEGDEITVENVEKLVGQPVVIELSDRAFEPGPVVGLLVELEDRIMTLYDESQGHGGAKAASVASAESIGRAHLVYRNIEGDDRQQ